MIRHIYVHIPFCARICPYCAFYKDLLDRSQTWRFCEAVLRDLDLQRAHFAISPSTIYFGGGTPTALTTAQLEFLLEGFRRRIDLSCVEEWTMEANPGSVSARKAAVLKKFGVNRISLGVQSWDDGLLKLLGREHNAQQAEQSFRILRTAGFTGANGKPVARELGEDRRAPTRTHFDLLPDVRGGHGILSSPREGRTSA